MRRLRTLAVLAGCFALFAGALVGSGFRAPAEGPAAGTAPGEVRFQKGNLHTHTRWSDGDQYPEMVVDWYRTHGYQFLALTDHNTLQEGERWYATDPALPANKEYIDRFGKKWVEQRESKGKSEIRLKQIHEFRKLFEEPGRFLMLMGEEISQKFMKYPVHINAFNLRDRVNGLDGSSVQESVQINMRAIAAQEKEVGRRMIGSLNHPNFGNAIRAEDYASLEEVRFFEAFNGHPGVKNYGDAVYPSVERQWDIVLTLRLAKHRLPLLYGLATDDAHAYHKKGPKLSNPGRGWVMVRSGELSPESLLKAMDAGDFYASSGVSLTDFGVAGSEYRLRIDGQPGVSYKTQFITTMQGTPLGSTPVLDKKGEAMHVTATYSPEIGKVVHEVTGTEPSYRMTGKELYVRARVTSSTPHPNPFQAGDFEMAWTQPVVPK